MTNLEKQAEIDQYIARSKTKDSIQYEIILACKRSAANPKNSVDRKIQFKMDVINSYAYLEPGYTASSVENTLGNKQPLWEA